MNFQNTIGALNRALVINKDDRSSLPLLRLPEFSVEKSISMDANGVPVAEASLKVPGILSYKAELALSSGNESGVAYTKKQCLLPLVETNPSIKAPSQERSASGCASDGGWKDWGHEERGGLHKRDSDDVWKDWGHEERGGLVNRDSNDAWKDWGHEERGGLGN